MLEFTLPGFQAALADRSHTAVGAIGERWFMAKLEKQGYVTGLSQAGAPGDVRVVCPKTGLVTYVEVKTARRGKDGKWSFTLWKKGKTDHRRAHWVALLAVVTTGCVVVFMCPVGMLAQQKVAVISSDPRGYAGKLARWRCGSEIKF